MNGKQINSLTLDVKIGVFDLIEMKLDSLSIKSTNEQQKLLNEIKFYISEKRAIAQAIKSQL